MTNRQSTIRESPICNLQSPMYDRDEVSRVVISGIGVVSPYGVGRERFWTHVTRGCSATRAITEFDAAAGPCGVAAPVPSSVTIEDAPHLDHRAGNGNGNGDGGA